MPWEKGEIPSDMYRHYFHGTSEKMQFFPCGHSMDDYYNADSLEHTHPFYHKFMQEIREQIAKNQKIIQTQRMFPHEQREFLLNGITCPKCHEKVTEIKTEVKNDFSEMPESRYRASKIMGWV